MKNKISYKKIREIIFFTIALLYNFFIGFTSLLIFLATSWQCSIIKNLLN